jgi:membrane-associated phospholipid phosphatase
VYLNFILHVTLTPTRLDIWFITKLATFLGRYPLFDLGVESAIRHNVFGGMCFAACIFIFWMQGARPGGQRIRQRVLTILFGTLLAIVLSLLSGELASWLPPSRNPRLAHFYPPYLMENINSNSFPSESTAVYAAVAAGIFSLHKLVGSALWVGVGLIVGLPRLYLGGHYPSDVLVGSILGLLAYFCARTFLEPSLSPYLERLFEQNTWPRAVGELIVFVWILQTGVGFREVAWVKNILQYTWRIWK